MPTLTESIQTIRNHCKKTRCEDCQFNHEMLEKKDESKDANWFHFCLLNQESPEDWDFKIVESNIYNQEEIHKNCTVQILKNSATGETSIGWWENDSSDDMGSTST